MHGERGTSVPELGRVQSRDLTRGLTSPARHILSKNNSLKRKTQAIIRQLHVGRQAAVGLRVVQIVRHVRQIRLAAA